MKIENCPYRTSTTTTPRPLIAYPSLHPSSEYPLALLNPGSLSTRAEERWKPHPKCQSHTTKARTTRHRIATHKKENRHPSAFLSKKILFVLLGRCTPSFLCLTFQSTSILPTRSTVRRSKRRKVSTTSEPLLSSDFPFRSISLEGGEKRIYVKTSASECV